MTDRASLEARLNYLRQQRKAWEKREKINSENFYLTPNHQSLNGSFKTPQNLVRASLFVEYAQALLDIEKQGHPLQAWTKFLRSITPSSFLSSPNSNKLLKIYEKATRSIVQCKENNNNLDFLRIWVTYAHLQKKLSLEDARDTFKYMMSERIGHHVAFFYLAWADFELKTGNTDKAKQILQKALQKGIEPQHSIKAALQLVVQGAISLLTDTEISVNCSNEDTPMQEMLKVEKSINIYPTPESDHKVFHPKTFEKNIEIQKQEACFSKLSISEENNNNNKVFTVNNSEHQ
ncbi:uncharacterized protein LOC135119594 [Zophobas morio]|uniref:uncharacterized protein LOC135119594 n=1 Tax=Zophobas morio TaxID=2755281 RepID=UPI003082F6B8